MFRKIFKYYLAWQAVKQVHKLLTSETPARPRRRFRRS
jgi:hypothetical protein